MKKFLMFFMQKEKNLANKWINTLVLHFTSCIVYKIPNDILGISLFSFMSMSAYHWQYPYVFIMALSFSYFITLSYIGRRSKRFFIRFYFYWLILLIVLLGILWSFLDMENGYYPPFPILLYKVGNDILRSVVYSPIIIISSIPYNIGIFIISLYLVKCYIKDELQ